MMSVNRALLGLGSLILAGCSATVPTNASTTFFKGGLVPASDIALTPTLSVTLEKLLYWGGVGAIAYYVVDPHAPNWEIQEAQFPDDHYMLSMKMKRYYTGGAGEARQVFNRRARDLANVSGFSGYKVLEYSEALDSNAIGSQRTAEGVIVLTGLVRPPTATTIEQKSPGK